MHAISIADSFALWRVVTWWVIRRRRWCGGVLSVCTMTKLNDPTFTTYYETCYNIGKDFSFPETYAWLLIHSNELDPSYSAELDGGGSWSRQIRWRDWGNDMPWLSVERISDPDNDCQISWNWWSGAYYIVSRANEFVKFITERRWAESKAPNGCSGG